VPSSYCLPSTYACNINEYLQYRRSPFCVPIYGFTSCRQN
jgi:hypothetical protein